MLNILPGRLQTNLVVPIAHNKTNVIFDYYYDDISSPSVKKIIEDDIIAQDIGYENITNYPLFEAMKKYQKDDIGSFLKIQKLCFFK